MRGLRFAALFTMIAILFGVAGIGNTRSAGRVDSQVATWIEFATWIEGLTNPATGLSCAEFDPHLLGQSDWRLEGDHYKILIAGEWRDVPAAAIVDRTGNPTGDAIAFYAGAADEDASVAPLVYCFVRPVQS